MLETILALLLWLDVNSDYDWKPEYGVPPIVQVEKDMLGWLLFLEPPSEQHLEEVKASTLTAIYRFDDGKIYVLDTIDFNTVWGRSVLLHELVHHLQYAQDLDEEVPCRAALELDAHELQAQYLVEHGLPEHNDAFTRAMRAACWDQMGAR